MILGIDATNIKSEGGIVHLFEILNNSNYTKLNIKKIFVWGNTKLLSKINSNKVIKKINVNNLTNNLFKRTLWQKFVLPKELKNNGCNFLFVPGGVLLSNSFKSVLVFQNILPFIDDEVSRYNLISRIKFFVQKTIYLHSFKNTQGIIFLSNSSKKIINKNQSFKHKKNIIISHGVSSIFKAQKNKKIRKNKLKLIYVSKFDIYKNQLELIDSFNRIKKNLNVSLTLIGDGSDDFKKKIKKKIINYNLEKDIKIYENIKYNKLTKIYNKHDIKIYPSKAETFGLTMLEAVKCGLPTLALKSDISKEILSEAGFYYSKLNDDLIKKLIYISKNRKIVNKKIKKGISLSNKYSWKKTSQLTFDFIQKIEKIEK